VDQAVRRSDQGAAIAPTASAKLADVSEQLHWLVGQFKTSA